MDKGTSTSTEFSYDERYVNYLMNNPERMEWKNGLIHSHNNMAVFYSGTDEKELATNAKAHNYYLSVVVNNKLDIIGRIGFIGEVEYTVRNPYQALDENGNKYVIKGSNFVKKEQKLFSYDCKISYEIPENGLDKEFMENVSEILKPKIKPFAAQKSPSYYPPNHSNNYDFGGADYVEWFESNNSPFTSPKKTDQSLIARNSDNKPFKEDYKTPYKQFLLICLGYSKSHIKDLDFEDCLKELQEAVGKEEFSDSYLEDTFIDNLMEYLDDFVSSLSVSEEIFEENLRVVFEEYSQKYKFLENIYNTIYIENE